jgi:hypothetical protein
VQVPRILGLLVRSGPHECACGHATHAHEHYRRGTDCALCACARYRGVPTRSHQPVGSRREQVRAA